MSHEWDRGVLNESSWHGLEEIGVMFTAEDMIAHGETSGAWPTVIRHDDTQTVAEGLTLPGRAVIADYKQHPTRGLSTVGGRFRATTPAEWRDLVIAACKAGAKPTGAFSLRGGCRVLATFEVGNSNGLRNNLMLADCFDGTIRLTGGCTSIRVVCANTLAAAVREDGNGMARLRHNSDLGEKIKVLGESIAGAITTGEEVRKLYEEAEQTILHKDDALAVFEKLFPTPPEEASKQAKTRAENKRNEAMLAAALPLNKVGDKGTLASLWNAATFLVDRNLDGTARKVTRGGNRLDSMLFGTRADRINEVHQVMVQVLQADGSVENMTVPEATAAGVPTDQFGGNILQSILDDME